MSRFAIKNPYFIVVVALIIAVIGVTAIVRMPVDMFPNINIPVVAVATTTTLLLPHCEGKLRNPRQASVDDR